MNKQHLQRPDNAYYYVRRVPNHAVATIGTKLIKVSLKTSDLKTAANREGEGKQ